MKIFITNKMPMAYRVMRKAARKGFRTEQDCPPDAGIVFAVMVYDGKVRLEVLPEQDFPDLYLSYWDLDVDDD